MYESFWGLQAKPFEDTFDAAFYYPSELHQGALLKLRYAIENRRGAVVLAGEPGLGKSLLAHQLCRQLPEECSPIGRILFPKMPAEQLLGYLAEELSGRRLDDTGWSVHSAVRRLDDILMENSAVGRHAVAIIEEAHLISDPRTLETLRLLQNFEFDGRPALTLLLVGDTMLLPAIERCPEFDQRMGVKCLMRPFTLEESISYIHHRMNAAGCKRDVFDDSALEAIFTESRGAPRKINRICDLALLIGFAEHLSQLSAEHIEGVAEELIAVAPE